MNLENIRNIVIATALIIAIVLGFIYQYTPQDEKTLTEFYQLEDDTYLIVIVKTDNKEEAEKIITINYPDYLIVERYRANNAFYYKLKKKVK